MWSTSEDYHMSKHLRYLLQYVSLETNTKLLTDWLLRYSTPTLKLGPKQLRSNLVPMYLSSTKNVRNHLIGACLPCSVDYSIFPVYHPRDVQVPISASSAALPGIPRKAFIHGQSQPSFFKIVYGGDIGITTREILTYSKIHMAQFDSPILTSELEGLVRDENGYVMGLVLSYIDCDGATLNCVDGHDPKLSDLRQKWVDQILANNWKTSFAQYHLGRCKGSKCAHRC